MFSLIKIESSVVYPYSLVNKCFGWINETCGLLKDRKDYRHNKLPAYLQHWQLITNINIHNHNTRRQHEIHIVGIKHSFAKRSLKHNLPITLNDTPQIVKDKFYTHSLQGFVNYAKYNFINKYQNSCANCYICMRN